MHRYAIAILLALTATATVAKEPEATPAKLITTLPGFKVERLYSVPSVDQGSWVSLTFDPKGRMLASDQFGALYRITPPPIGSDAPIKVEPLKVPIGRAQGLLY